MSTSRCRLRPAIFFPRVVAPIPAAAGRLDRLAVQHGGRRVPGATVQLPHLGPQGVVDPVPGAVGLPPPEVGVHRLPRRIVVRHGPPRAPGAEQVEHRVGQVAVVVLPRPAARLRSREQVLDVVPLEVLQVGRVWLPCHAT